jgi:hypothetical protein
LIKLMQNLSEFGPLDDVTASDSFNFFVDMTRCGSEEELALYTVRDAGTLEVLCERVSTFSLSMLKATRGRKGVHTRDYKLETLTTLLVELRYTLVEKVGSNCELSREYN